jgi:hypothetical protein
VCWRWAMVYWWCADGVQMMCRLMSRRGKGIVTRNWTVNRYCPYQSIQTAVIHPGWLSTDRQCLVHGKWSLEHNWDLTTILIILRSSWMAAWNSIDTYWRFSETRWLILQAMSLLLVKY